MIQRRVFMQVAGLHVRGAEGEEESRPLEGHPVVFGQRSLNLVPWNRYREVYEVMEPGCIDDELLKRSDIVLTAFHDNSIILGRSTNGKGTLEIGIDDKGVWIRCELPDTERANEYLQAISRGDISGMSFAYTADEEDSENGVSYEREEKKTDDGKDVWVRHVKKVTGFYDVTIAGHPAYPQTDVAQRELEDALTGHLITPNSADEFARMRENAARMRRAANLSRQLDLLEY